MQIFRIAPLVAAMMACVSGALAQETQAYTYDVHGRLTKVVRTQGSTTRTTNYAIDNANNRTSRAITSTTSSSAMAALAEEEAEAVEHSAEVMESEDVRGLDQGAEPDAEASSTAVDATADPVLADDDLLPAVDAASLPEASED